MPSLNPKVLLDVPPFSSTATNNFLAVSIKRSESSIGWQLTCSLLSGFPAGVNASCRVAFGTDPSFTSLPYSASSTGEAAANGSVIVSISERLNSSTTYYYRVTAIEGDNHVVTVLGSFITGLFSKFTRTYVLYLYIHSSCTWYTSRFFPLSDCDKMDLVPDEHNVSESGTSTGCTGDQLVFASEGSMSLRGVVCYTGTSPGSTAVYSASPGCALSQESRVRTCMDNGLWSGAPAVVVSRGEGQGPAYLVGGMVRQSTVNP